MQDLFPILNNTLIFIYNINYIYIYKKYKNINNIKKYDPAVAREERSSECCHSPDLVQVRDAYNCL